MGKCKVTAENCLTTEEPEIASLWHPTLNGNTSPSDIRAGAYAKAWWKCSKGHEWKAMVRTLEAGVGCPECLELGKFVPGKNDLGTVCHKIAGQWHPEKNGNLSPGDVSVFSNYRAWWICAKGHEWQTIVEGRTKQNSGCGFCSGHHLLAGENDLETMYPDVAAEWNYAENSRRPQEYKPSSSVKVSWICKKGHKWVASIEKRTDRMQGCPYCSGRVAIPGENDIATVHPEVMYLWDFDKNEEASVYPENVKPYSDKKVWCICPKGHSWNQRAKKLTGGGTCPYCLNYAILPGENDFATLAPTELMAQWNYEKNTVLKPTEIALHSPQKVWWKCVKGHEWMASPDGRLRGGVVIGCPYCFGLLAAKGETDLATKAPELLEEYQYERNRKKPDEIHWGSTKKVWWKCKMCGHEWRSQVGSRTKAGNGCSRCHGRGKM